MRYMSNTERLQRKQRKADEKSNKKQPRYSVNDQRSTYHQIVSMIKTKINHFTVQSYDGPVRVKTKYLGTSKAGTVRTHL